VKDSLFTVKYPGNCSQMTPSWQSPIAPNVEFMFFLTFSIVMIQVLFVFIFDCFM